MQSEPGCNLPVLLGPRLNVGVHAETTAHQPRDGPRQASTHLVGWSLESLPRNSCPNLPEMTALWGLPGVGKRAGRNWKWSLLAFT